MAGLVVVAGDVGVAAIVASFADVEETAIVMLSFETELHHHPVEAVAVDVTEKWFRTVAKMIGDVMTRSVVADSVPDRLRSTAG